MFSSRFNRIIILSIFSALSAFATDKNQQLLTVNCKQYLDSMPLVRSITFGEEQIVTGNYQGLAQQYTVSGTIKSVVFSGRSNPSSSIATSSVKVVVYNANLGLPGTILSSANVVIDSASSNSMHEAILPVPVSVNGNIIIALEPLIPSVDNFFVQRNTPPDGQNLNLIKIKQANQWFKNLAAGDPAFDYDFMIFPVKEVILTPNFTFNTNALQVSFNNTSSITNCNFQWDFGDGITSTMASPTHSYTSSGTFQVKLKMIYNGMQICEDSIIKSVVVSSVGLTEASNDAIILWRYDAAQQQLNFQSKENGVVKLCDASGRWMQSVNLKAGLNEVVDCQSWSSGVYLISSDNGLMNKFFKD
ncbi:MAG: PKD domain-containing protein [Bacteroidota bacterium]